MSEAILGATALSMMHGSWTVEDLSHVSDDGQRYEIIDGSLLVSPPPAPGHQGIARRLVATLNHHLGPGWEAVEAVGVVLRDEPSVRMLQPDIVVASSEALWSGGTTLRAADVALVVEIVSPSSVTADRVTKPTLLAEAGVPAYWRIEQPAEGVTVSLSRLVGGAYKEDDVVREGETRHVEWPVRCRLAPGELVGPRGGRDPA